MERASLDHLVIPTTESEKLLLVLDLIRRCGWKLGEFLLALFAPPPVKGKGATGRLPEHSLRVQKFLNGEARVGVGAILRAWTEHRDSRGKGEAGVLSLERPYDEGSRSACAALNAYAVWVVVREMEKEMRAVTASDAGLHVLEPARAGEPQKLWVKWEDFGENTVNDVSTIMQKFQPLTWTLWMHIATPKKGEEGKTSDREKRPPAIVSHLLSVRTIGWR